MNSFNQILESFSGQGPMFTMDGFAVVLVVYLLLSWLVCVVAAFCNVREVKYSVGLIAMGLTLLLALVLGGLCRNLLPGLAATFTPGGLFLFSALAGILICSVPVVQYFWNVSYWRGLACVVGGVVVFTAGLILVQVLAHPNESISARLSVPLFQQDSPLFTK